jgi:NADPH:quinone reductase-like Zn-dependent oxidoreductase
MASNEPTTIDFEAERQFGVQKRLEPFTVRAPFGPDLAYLVELLADGEIDPQIGLRTSWDDVADAAEALLGRRVAGKAVLDVA